MQTVLGSATLLFWVAVGQSLGESLRPGCDNGKVLLDTDLPKDASFWKCPTALWTTYQRLYSVDTVYDPEPAKLTCMNQLITFNHTIPNSGAFRPVAAASGEYLFCPPQRWLNNLHRGATVLLYHPCSSPLERLLLSALAQSCFSNFVLTPHKDLHKNRPVALVSWGRTLEVSTAASSEICDWLDTTRATKSHDGEKAVEHQYDLLLTRSAELDKHKENKISLKHCCRQALSSVTEDVKKTQPHSSFQTGTFRKLKARAKRAAVKSTTILPKTSIHPSRKVTHKLQSNTLTKPISADQSIAKDAHQDSKDLKENPIPKKLNPDTPLTQTSSSNRTERNHKKDNEAVNVEEREAGDAKSPQNVSKSSDSLPGDGGAQQSRGEASGGGFQRTPRTDEAVWAAGALGFLLVLLTLSILHTRLYKHWRRGTSLYWRDPRQDYDSVADVIRRRLRLAKKRRKRTKKKECVLVPSSSSSEEYP